MTKILFLCENISDAHILRSFALAKALKDTYSVYFAYNKSNILVQDSNIKVIYMPSTDRNILLNRLYTGEQLYNLETIKRYINVERGLIENIKPDLIISDFRLTASISARIYKIPLITVSNACWSPEYKKEIPVPCIPLAKICGTYISQKIFSKVYPQVTKRWLVPFNTLRLQYNIETCETLDQLYCDGDITVFPDSESVFSVKGNFLGPIAVSQSGVKASSDHNIFVMLGSSGIANLEKIIDAIDYIGYNAIVATKDTKLDGEFNSNISDVIITNGGNMSTYLAAFSNKPVLAVPSNIDQLLCSDALHKANVCNYIRSDKITKQTVAESLKQLLSTNMNSNYSVNNQRFLYQNSIHQIVTNLLT